MLRGSHSVFSCLVAGGLAVSVTSSASAQHYPQAGAYSQAGVVRVSDINVPPVPGATSNLQPVPENGAPYNNGEAYYDNCPPYGQGYGYGSRNGNYVRTFSPPVKRPIYRAGVAYNKMWPDQWTGQTANRATNYQYPTVYMPTDTTQLGYYYQHVPYWQPREGMVPPPPVPSQWHTTIAQSQYQGHAPAGKFFGTAPTAVPASPTPAPTHMTTPAPVGATPLPTDIPSLPVEPTSNIIPAPGLERSASQPLLFPIN